MTVHVVAAMRNERHQPQPRFPASTVQYIISLPVDKLTHSAYERLGIIILISTVPDPGITTLTGLHA